MRTAFFVAESALQIQKNSLDQCQLLKCTVFHQQCVVLFHISFSGRRIFSRGAILGKYIAHLVELFWLVVRFTHQQIIISGLRVLIQRILSMIMSAQNPGYVKDWVHAVEQIRFMHIQFIGKNFRLLIPLLSRSIFQSVL